MNKVNGQRYLLQMLCDISIMLHTAIKITSCLYNKRKLKKNNEYTMSCLLQLQQKRFILLIKYHFLLHRLKKYHAVICFNIYV